MKTIARTTNTGEYLEVGHEFAKNDILLYQGLSKSMKLYYYDYNSRKIFVFRNVEKTGRRLERDLEQSYKAGKFEDRNKIKHRIYLPGVKFNHEEVRRHRYQILYQ
jgi:hypothetical protein